MEDLSPLAGYRCQTLKLVAPRLTDLRPLAGLADLKTLSLTGDKIADLRPLAGLVNLQALSLEGDKITDLRPLAKLRPALTRLAITSNSLTDLRPLGRLPQLWRLELKGEALTDLAPLARISRLHTLSLEGSNLGDFTFLTKLKNLARLVIINPRLPNLDFLTGLTGLTALAIATERLETDWEPLSHLGGLTSLLVRTTGRRPPALPRAVRAKLKKMHDSWLDIGPMGKTPGDDNFHSLLFSRNIIFRDSILNEESPPDQAWTGTLTVTEPQAVALLKSIYENNGPGRLDWDFSRPGRVTVFDDGTVEVKAGALIDLRLEKAGLTGELKIHNAPHLDNLVISGNRLAAVELKNLPALEYIYISDPCFKTLALAGGLGRSSNENEIARIAGARLERLVVTGFNYLFELIINKSRLSDLTPIARLRSLYQLLKVASDRLSDLGPLKGRSVQDLSLSSPLLGDLRPLEGMKHLQELVLRGDGITDLSPLAKLRYTRLDLLDIYSKNLADIRPLAKLRGLTTLGLFSDALSDLSPLGALPWLYDVVLEGKSMKDFRVLLKLEDRLSHLKINKVTLRGRKARQDERPLRELLGPDGNVKP